MGACLTIRISGLTGNTIRLAGILLLLSSCSHGQTVDGLPDGFVSLTDLDSSIQQDIRYHSSNNFLGRPVTGYRAPACILTEAAAQALRKAQSQAQALGYSLKVYDCYRPQQAVNDFVAWAAQPGDTVGQARFYPDVPKSELFTQGYIAERSGHSRGSTVDLTLVPLASSQPRPASASGSYDCRLTPAGRYPDNSLDMGTGYDCFDPLSHTDNPTVSGTARHNRDLLRRLMQSAGFSNYPNEWWHYTLDAEPYPDRYFDFEVR